MRKVGLGTVAGLMLLAASLMAPASASAAAPRLPGPAGPHAVARPAHVTSPGVLRPSPRTVSPGSIACDGQFHAVASPNGIGDNNLLNIATVSANDVWAVGIQTTATPFDRTLAEHWNGTSWTIVPTTNPGTRSNDLFGVSAISSNNVWAVGAYETNSAHASATIALHWNGSSWIKVATVNPSAYSYLYAVTAVSSTNVWAVGTYYNFTALTYQTLVEHYNGSTWSRVSSPNTGASDTWNQLFAISAFSANDIWAVGSLSPSSGANQSLALHWDGTSWVVVSTPNTTTGDNEILGVTALEAGHAVGVGYGAFITSTAAAQGFQWNLVVSPSTSTMGRLNPGVTGNVVFEGVARSLDNVWVGGYSQATISGVLQSMVWHATWDASAHTLTWASSPGSSDNPGAIDNILYAVAALTPSVFWAAGSSFSGTTDQTTTEVFCALHFNVAAPGSVVPGSAFSVTVTAKNADLSTASDYLGTITFASSDPQATLPANYVFTPGDAGTHTFSGVVLRSTSQQSINASDTVTPFITGSASITVACAGVCQAPPGTPGGRNAFPGPPGTPGGRNAFPGPAPGPPGRTSVSAGRLGPWTRIGRN